MTRRMTRYSRVEADGTARLMLLFTSPPEVEGVAMLATRPPDEDDMQMAMYLPALGAQLVESGSGGAASSFLGTDFTIENLIGEVLDDYRYARRRSRLIRGVPHHVIDVFDVRDEAQTVCTSPARITSTSSAGSRSARPRTICVRWTVRCGAAT